MVFSSVLFLFRFLPMFAASYFLAPKKMKNFIFFIGSLIFYAWGEPVYVFLMLFSTISDYVCGIQIEKMQLNGKKGKQWLIVSLTINLLVLGFFKYADFLIEATNALAETNFSLLNLPLPIGISFYTFQTMSYSIDVYKKNVSAQKNFLAFGVFVTMFPQLIAGPIVKYKEVEKNLIEREHSLKNISYGIERVAIGLSKKTLLANNIGILWDTISQRSVDDITVVMAWIGIAAYAMQIYFDFSGYSDMAIGLGRIFGFEFLENFNYPYISKSITEFWRRWHISLGSWFREYVYIPLGGNRVGIKRQILNILCVWAVTGIWHGAGLNFLLWGIWFAIFLIIEKIFLRKYLEKLPGIIGWIYSAVVVLIGWVFFSLEEVDVMIAYLMVMLGIGNNALMNKETLYIINNYWRLFLILFIGVTPFAKQIYNAFHKWIKGDAEVINKFKIFGIVVLFVLSIAYIVDASYNPFLYFRF